MNERVWSKGPVLIVEDHADSLQMICDWLEAMRIPCVGAPDGRAALDAVRKYRPSVILLDISMPDMNGIEFRRAQLGLPDPELVRIPIVLLTALPNPRKYGFRAGGDGRPSKTGRHLQAVDARTTD
jgi:CheY-like chemotaxis protein